ncbi:MAG: endonuclease/exonuclease/phosphatase family protein [Planctomycetota bacterium]
METATLTLPKTPDRKISKKRRWIKRISILLLTLFLLYAPLPYLLRGPSEISPPIETVLLNPAGVALAPPHPQLLTVMTLNLAHGRKDKEHQALLSKEEIEENLKDIAEVFKRENPDVVALQEADGPSIWSGKFNHVEYLAQKASFNYWVRGEHVKKFDLSYGTALLSKWPLSNTLAVTFALSWPTPPKGFTVSTITLPTDPPFEADFVSVHLDFSRESLRKKQIQEIIQHLQSRNRPLIVMGDFNNSWALDENKTAVQQLAEKLNLKAYQPILIGHETHPTTKKFLLPPKRMDWILISDHFQFSEYKTLSDLLSDHRAVVAVLERK